MNCNRTRLGLFLLLLNFIINAHGVSGSMCEFDPSTLVSTIDETTAIGFVLQTASSTDIQSLTFKSQTGTFDFSCYFDYQWTETQPTAVPFPKGDATLRLKKQFDFENFKDCTTNKDYPLPTTTSLNDITVRIYCGNTLAAAIVVNGVNEFPPVFTEREIQASVSESNEVGYLIKTLKDSATDQDYGAFKDLLYDIESGNDAGYFQVKNAQLGDVHLVKPLDYDLQSNPKDFLLNITVKDSVSGGFRDYTSLNITILDFDDKNPAFTEHSYLLSLPENFKWVSASDWLSTEPALLATDGDKGILQTIKYRIKSASFSDWAAHIQIDADNGKFKITKEFDRETMSPDYFSLQVEAYQTDKPDIRVGMTTVTVQIGDKNDNNPAMAAATYTKSITENAPAQTYLMTLKATDVDKGNNAKLNYVIEDTTGIFQVDAVTGDVRVANSNKLDRETLPQVVFKAYAIESSTSEKQRSPDSTVTVTLIDVNDNSPSFTSNSLYIFNNIPETAAEGTKVGTVTATDPDQGPNAVVTYKIDHVTSEGKDYFKITNSGEIQINKQLSLKTSFVSQYDIVVKAYDNPTDLSHQRFSSAVAVVTIVDQETHAPVFGAVNYTVSLSEVVPVGTIVASLKASDKDPSSADKLVYQLGDGADAGFFKMDASSGVVTLLKMFDRETKAEHRVEVVVTDGAHNASTELIVTVLDFNDNSPTFGQPKYSFQVAEGQLDGSNLSPPLTATDADEPGTPNSQIRYSLHGADNYFKIDATTGQLSTKNGAQLDRESTPNSQLQFTVLAVDQADAPLARTGTAEVVVVVTDVNDETPKFSAASYDVTVFEDTTPLDFFTLTSTDKDSLAENQVPVYSIEAGSPGENIFKIDPTSGKLSAKAALKFSQFGSAATLALQVAVRNSKAMTAGAAAKSTAVVNVKLKVSG